MYQLLLAVCINGDAALCMDRRLPLGEEMNMMRCMREGLVHAQKWADDHPDLELRSWRCVTPEKTPEPLENFAVEEIGDGVFVHRGRHAIPSPANLNDTSNIGFVIGEESVAVIDAGGSAAVASAVMFHIRERTDLPVQYLILTHMHPDHVLGAQVFRDAGATIIGHRKLDRALKARARTYTDNLRRLIGEQGFEGSAIVLPDEGVDGTRELDLGGRILRLEAHPTAHTDNDLTVLDEQTGLWFLGDLLFAGHTPALDGSITGWIERMKALSKAPAVVVPASSTNSAASNAGASDAVFSRSWLASQPRATGSSEFKCLAEALYFEARGETVKGQFAVAEVIRNRVKSSRFPNSFCAVINEGTGKKHRCQFSYTCDGRPETISEPAAYARVAKVARATLDGKAPDITHGATFYHTTAVRPSWSRKFTNTARYGVHLFYRRGVRTASN